MSYYSATPRHRPAPVVQATSVAICGRGAQVLVQKVREVGVVAWLGARAVALGAEVAGSVGVRGGGAAAGAGPGVHSWVLSVFGLFEGVKGLWRLRGWVGLIWWKERGGWVEGALIYDCFAS